VSALQIHLFLTNKAKFRKVKLNVNKVLIRDYEQLDTWSIGIKQSQTKPNKPKSNPIQSQYKPNTKPIQSQYEPNSNPIYPVVASGEAGTNPISSSADNCFLGLFLLPLGDYQ